MPIMRSYDAANAPIGTSRSPSPCGRKNDSRIMATLRRTPVSAWCCPSMTRLPGLQHVQIRTKVYGRVSVVGFNFIPGKVIKKTLPSGGVGKEVGGGGTGGGA